VMGSTNYAGGTYPKGSSKRISLNKRIHSSAAHREKGRYEFT